MALRLRRLRPSDIPAAADTWNTLAPPKYRIAPDLLLAKTLQHPSFLPYASFAATENGALRGFVATKLDPVGHLFLAKDPAWRPDRRHINSLAFQSPEIGQTLLQAVLQATAQRQGPLVFGQDVGHFFPGVPEEATHLSQFLLANGFVKNDTPDHDLQCDLATYEPPAGSLGSLQQPGVRFARCTPEDVPALEEFLLREFPGRWHYDTIVHKCQTLEEPEDVFALWVDGAVEGFAYTQSQSSSALPVGGPVWCQDLGPNWGGLGPIGVSEKVRGRKLGGATLAGALLELKRAGVRNCTIDWTSLVGFYQKYGFQVTRRYQAHTHP